MAPAVVAHLGTEVSRLTLIAPGISAIYLPIPLGLAMAWWWGPRVLVGVYVNAVFSAGLWNLPEWHRWPLYALPETLAVLAGWWLFERVARGRSWLPRLPDVVRFIVFAVLPAALLNGFLVAGQLVAFGDLPRDEFWSATWSGGIATMLDGLAIAAPLAMLVTPLLERRGWSRTVGAAAMRIANPAATPWAAAEIVAAFAGILVLGRLLPLERYWSAYGLFVIWAAVRHGAMLAVVANLWIELVGMLLPAVVTRAAVLPTAELQNLQTALVVVCIVGLVVGRTISDQRDEIEQRREADRALAESEAFLRLSQQAGHVGSWQWDLRTNRIKWSDELARMHGITAAEFDGTLATITALCHPDDRLRLRAAMEHARAGARVSDFECRILPRGGGQRYLLFTGQVQRDEQNAPTRVVGIGIDITERRRAEQALVESEERLRLIIRDQTEFIVKWLPDGTRTFVNESYCRYFGVTEAECVGTSFFPLVAPEHREMLRRKVEALSPAAPEATTEHVSFAANGERRWQLWTDRGTFDASGRLVELLSTGRDVTERRKAEAALREMAQRYRAILESSLDGVIVMDSKGEVLEFNAAAELLFGYGRGEAVGRRVADLLVPPQLRAAHAEGLAHYLATGEGKILGRRLEMPALRADGGEIRVELAVSAIAGTDPPLFAAAVRDISQRLRLEEQLRQAQKMEAVGQLAGGIAHDFNNLLTVITGYTDIVRQLLPAGDAKIEMVDQIHQAGQRSAGLTRQLLAFSRRQVLSPRVLDLNDVVRDVEKMLRRVIGEDVSFATVLAPQLGRVRADPGQLEQVLLNLAVNARDAMPRGGKLTIETGEAVLGEEYARSRLDVSPGAYVRLTVTDTGTGMTPEIKERIFEPFFTTKEAGRGTGLGLSVVHGIVKQSGGHIEVYSEVGIGTSFKMYLPLARVPGAAATTATGDAAPAGGTETILLVEDEDAVRALTSRALREKGYTVLESGSGEAALRMADEHHGAIDLLITDVVMPVMSGRMVAERFVALYPEAKVLYVSGYTDDAVIRHGILHEQVSFLQKPFSLRAIAQKVREVLAK